MYDATVMPTFLGPLVKAYYFRKAVNRCRKFSRKSDEYTLAHFYKAEIEKWEDEDTNLDNIEKLKRHAERNRERFQQSEPICEMLNKLDSFLEALKPLA